MKSKFGNLKITFSGIKGICDASEEVGYILFSIFHCLNNFIPNGSVFSPKLGNTDHFVYYDYEIFF